MKALERYKRIQDYSLETNQSNYDVAKFFEVDEATVRRALKKPADQIEKYFAKRREELDKPVRLSHNDGAWVATADWHVPLTDGKYVSQFLRHCKRHGIRNLMIVGDFLNGDELSQYFPKQLNANMDREIREARSIMRKLLASFDRVVYTWGNHDYRYVKAYGYKQSFVEAMREKVFYGHEFDKIEFTNLDHVYLTDTKNGTWYLCHPANYSSQPLANGRKLASIKMCNIATAHSHHCAVGTDASGKYMVVEMGGLFDIASTEYLRRSTTFPQWTQGFMWWDKEGKVHVESPMWS
jgi:predicted phosphodiesterase